MAIVLEGPPADDLPGTSSDTLQGKLGGGVQIRLYDPSMIANPRLAELTIETATAHQIPHQIAVRTSGGDGCRGDPPSGAWRAVNCVGSASPLCPQPCVHHQYRRLPSNIRSAATSHPKTRFSHSR